MSDKGSLSVEEATDNQDVKEWSGGQQTAFREPSSQQGGMQSGGYGHWTFRRALSDQVDAETTMTAALPSREGKEQSTRVPDSQQCLELSGGRQKAREVAKADRRALSD